ncbi:MAG: hypothetical protein HeimC2_20430 [Candidatus Heimdallarchaeota archaeon LC_2]|nr:MAG: hypothetical protein HeimC2_20430 [Candidatus Heimdallarchaeota archaeon LC_2]
MLFHGPTSINYHDGTKITDLRNRTLPASIDIVVNSSQYAVVIDTDYSQGNDDYYAYIESSNTTYQPINGFLSMLVVDRKASVSNSMIVLSGERVYSDYKNMYGNTWERQPELVHQGSLIVDNLLNYYFVTSGEFNDITTTPTITDISTTTSPDITDFTIISTTTGSVITAIDSDEGPDTIDSVVSLPLPIMSFFVAIIFLGIGNLFRGKFKLN